jgi:hypothetical protein
MTCREWLSRSNACCRPNNWNPWDTFSVARGNSPFPAEAKQEQRAGGEDLSPKPLHHPFSSFTRATEDTEKIQTKARFVWLGSQQALKGFLRVSSESSERVVKTD